MVFEDFYDRRSLEDPYSKITISKNEYRQLREIAEKYETLVKKFKDVEAKKSELHRQLEEMRDDGRKLKDLEEKTEKYLNSLVRVQADFENYKKSNHRENERYKMRIKEEILRKLIKHYEDLQRALKILETLENSEQVKKGFEMIMKNFEKILEVEGVREMKCEGQKFDPYKHEAMMVEEDRDDLPESTIVEELEKGYYFNNKILRPAKVKISKRSKLQNLNENQIKIKIENKN